MSLVTAEEKFVLCDYVIIRDDLFRIGDDDVKPDDPKDANGNPVKAQPEFREKFLTEYRWDKGGAVLTLNVSQLTVSKKNVPIKINGKSIGEICRYFGQTSSSQKAWEYWYSQTISFPADVLKQNGVNEILIPASEILVGHGGAHDKLDDFYIKDVVLWYKQEQAGWLDGLLKQIRDNLKKLLPETLLKFIG